MDDDRAILAVIKRHLTARGFVVVIADSGSEALMLVRESRPDIILVDAGMPGLDGLAFCRVLKQQPQTQSIPVVLMSGTHVSEKDVLSGFAGGADDYVEKPFSLSVLAARLEAVMRRFDAPSALEAKLKKRGIELDPAGRTVTADGKRVALTRKEFDLLAVLLSKAGRVLGVPYLLETVWGYDPADYNESGTVEVHVSHLRKKLGPRLAKHIVNVPGHGYKFEERP